MSQVMQFIKDINGGRVNQQEDPSLLAKTGDGRGNRTNHPGRSGSGTGGHTAESVKQHLSVSEPDKDNVSSVHMGAEPVGHVGTLSNKSTWVSQHGPTGAMETHSSQHEAVAHLAGEHANYMNNMHSQVGSNSKYSIGDKVNTTGIGAGEGTVVSMHPLQGQWQYQVEKPNGRGGTDTGSHPERSLE